MQIKTIKKIVGCDKKRFDITVESNANYFANGILIHNSSARYVVDEQGVFHVGSRTTWKYKPGTLVKTLKVKNPNKTVELVRPRNVVGGFKALVQAWFTYVVLVMKGLFAPKEPDVIDKPLVAKGCSWWTAAEQNPWIEEWCRKNPGAVVYGEIFGSSVQGEHFHYGYKGKDIGFRVFDVMERGKWIACKELHDNPRFSDLQKVAVVYRGKYQRSTLEGIAEEPESFNACGHVREGVVIKLEDEGLKMPSLGLGRIALKLVSNNYLMKS